LVERKDNGSGRIGRKQDGRGGENAIA
jgi:hypothetical protein